MLAYEGLFPRVPNWPTAVVLVALIAAVCVLATTFTVMASRFDRQADANQEAKDRRDHEFRMAEQRSGRRFGA
jgi:hypothetical protein